jgi:hypothetical protein
MSVKMRQEVERKIATAAIDAILAAGFAISIDNGGDEYELAHSTDKDTILKSMFLADEDRLFVEPLETKKGTRRGNSPWFGWLYLVYGNDGWDVISDYTVNLEKYVGTGSEAQKLSDYYGG